MTPLTTAGARAVTRPCVLMVIPSLGVGGAERLLVDLIAHSNRQQFEFAVLSLSGGALAPELAKLGVAITRVRCRGNLDPQGARAFARALQDLRPDLVHVHLHPHATLYWLPALARRAGARAVIAHLHAPAGYHQRRGWRQRVRAWLDRVDRRHYDRLLAISEVVARSYADPGHRVSRVETLLSGVDLPRFARGAASVRQSARQEFGLVESALVVGTVASLYPAKGHRYLVTAAAQVVAAVPEARFLFIGEGVERASLEQQATGLGLVGKVIFAGVRSDVPELLNALDVFVLPSLTEGFGLAACEAMATEVPVVATNVGGLPEVVEDDVTGLLVPPADPEALAREILRLARDPELRARMGQAGRRRVEERFDIRITAEKLQQIYRELLT